MLVISIGLLNWPSSEFIINRRVIGQTTRMDRPGLFEQERRTRT